MKYTLKYKFYKRTTIFFVSVILLSFFSIYVNAQTENHLRRPITPDQPMWLIHIDTWNYADPQKIIDLIPEDIRPFIVMNISLSISHNVETSQFQVAEYGYEIAKSWLRTCAQNQMWAMVQPSSGGYSHFSDFDLSVYEEFYRDYPNMIGFNYCEQFWGYDDPSDPLSPRWPDRIEHFANLLELSNHYGCYLVVSWCSNQWGAINNPIGMLKRMPNFAEACRKYTENYILLEKFTQTGYILDVESTCLGAYLSGYSGQCGLRYDDTGWTDGDGEHEGFILATGGAPHMERLMLYGSTVIDAPELIWTQCFRELSRNSTTEGYTQRRWGTFPQFDNFSIDLFRKVLDGTIRIPTREEVIDRTKVVIVNDVNTGSNDDIYSTPETIFEGHISMDGNYEHNMSFFKKTGQYPTIPTVFQLDDSLANSFEVKINKTDYSNRWPSISDKMEELSTIFPEKYTGDIFAGRHENGWVIYNPYKEKTPKTANGTIPFKYNTSDSIEFTLWQYTSGVMKEYSDKLNIYLSNFDEYNTSLKTDIIKIYGCDSEPSYSYEDRADHPASELTKEWTNGTFTLTVKHNGPLDLTINCAGTATGRLTDYSSANIIAPEKPAIYTGPRQYEAECFDYKNINEIITGGNNRNIRNYTGQGYCRFGTNASASVRDTVYALRNGTYMLKTRYSVTGGNVNTVDLYVNGVKTNTPSFTETETLSEWDINTQSVELNAGKNVIEFKANATGAYNVAIDNIVITQGNNNGVYHFENDIATTNASTPPAELITIRSGSAGVVSYTDIDNVSSNCFKSYTSGSINGTGIANLDMFPENASNYILNWKEFNSSFGGNKGILLRGSGDPGSCPYAENMKQGYLFIVSNNDDSTVTLRPYIADTSGLIAKPTYTGSFKNGLDSPCWYRAIAVGNKLTFECSKDSISWEGADSTTFIDSTYSNGSTELVWGLDADNFDWVMDDISYSNVNVGVSVLSLEGLNYMQGAGPSIEKAVKISGYGLMDDIHIIVSNGYEISVSPNSGYDTSLTVYQLNGTVEDFIFYVRLKDGLPIDKYNAELKISSKGTLTRSLFLEGEVEPQPISLTYNFSNDMAGTTASTPPALNTTIGQGNTATAGVVSFTDANEITSNMLTPYGVGQRNETGVIDLNLFSNKSTNYSVTWKQCIGSASSPYKIGVLLRGDTNNIAGSTTGYVEGMMHGYLFIVYNTGSGSEFRIYKSTDATNLNTYINNGMGSLDPDAGQPMWYRASVTGSDEVSLTFEYSTDKIIWHTAATATDNSATSFKSGATQVVWGLAITSIDFYLDDITFYGITLDSGELPEVIEVSDKSLQGFEYEQGFGPSQTLSFDTWGNPLESNVNITASAGFEVSLDQNSGYASEIILPVSDDSLDVTTIFVRMSSGLLQNEYTGNVIISSNDVLSRYVRLTGTVKPGPEITTTVNQLSNFEYDYGVGPSMYKTFKVSGTLLVDNIIVEAPDNYEISLNSNSGYSSSLTIIQTEREISSTNIYVLLKEGLEVDSYTGDITLNSTGAFEKTVSITGQVLNPTGINEINASPATVILKEYYTLTGQKVTDISNLKGIFIVRNFMSDGTVKTTKIFIGENQQLRNLNQ